jgi:AcrR family transcriptional regulator
MPRRPDLARRAELAKAAFDVLRARGMQTSMRELADALGLKRPTLYFYFPDLGAVFETVLEQMYQALTDAVLARVAEHAHPIDRLRAVIDATLAFHRDRPQLLHGLVQLWALGGRDLAVVLERERRGVLAAREAMIAELRAGIARKEVRPCKPERVIDLVLAFIEGAIVHHVIGIARIDGGPGDRAALDDTVDELARRVLEPLRAQRRRKRTRP